MFWIIFPNTFLFLLQICISWYCLWHQNHHSLSLFLTILTLETTIDMPVSVTLIWDFSFFFVSIFLLLTLKHWRNMNVLNNINNNSISCGKRFICTRLLPKLVCGVDSQNSFPSIQLDLSKIKMLFITMLPPYLEFEFLFFSSHGQTYA